MTSNDFNTPCATSCRQAAGVDPISSIVSRSIAGGESGQLQDVVHGKAIQPPVAVHERMNTDQLTLRFSGDRDWIGAGFGQLGLHISQDIIHPLRHALRVEILNHDETSTFGSWTQITDPEIRIALHGSELLIRHRHRAAVDLVLLGM